MFQRRKKRSHFYRRDILARTVISSRELQKLILVYLLKKVLFEEFKHATLTTRFALQQLLCIEEACSRILKDSKAACAQKLKWQQIRTGSFIIRHVIEKCFSVRCVLQWDVFFSEMCSSVTRVLQWDVLPWGVFFSDTCSSVICVLQWHVFFSEMWSSVRRVLQWDVFFSEICSSVTRVLQWEVFFSDTCSSVRCVLQWRHNQRPSWKKTHFQDACKITLPINPPLIKGPSLLCIFLFLFSIPFCWLFILFHSIFDAFSYLLVSFTPPPSHSSDFHHRPFSLISTAFQLSDLHDRPISLTTIAPSLWFPHHRPTSLTSTIAPSLWSPQPYHLSDLHHRCNSLLPPTRNYVPACPLILLQQLKKTLPIVEERNWAFGELSTHNRQMILHLNKDPFLIVTTLRDWNANNGKQAGPAPHRPCVLSLGETSGWIPSFNTRPTYTGKKRHKQHTKVHWCTSIYSVLEFWIIC